MNSVGQISAATGEAAEGRKRVLFGARGPTHALSKRAQFVGTSSDELDQRSGDARRTSASQAGGELAEPLQRSWEFSAPTKALEAVVDPREVFASDRVLLLWVAHQVSGGFHCHRVQTGHAAVKSNARATAQAPRGLLELLVTSALSRQRPEPNEMQCDRFGSAGTIAREPRTQSRSAEGRTPAKR